MVTCLIDSLNYRSLSLRLTEDSTMQGGQRLGTGSVAWIWLVVFKAARQLLGLFQNFPHATGHRHHLRDI
jgi:hypothetical protein